MVEFDASVPDLQELAIRVMSASAKQADADLKSAMTDVAGANRNRSLADELRQRAADGDTGTSVSGSTAPGWGGSPVAWLPWVGLLVVGAVLGSVIGASGLAGAPTTNLSVYTTNASVPAAAATYICPGGAQIGALHGGDRVVAVQRSDDSGFLGVRDPLDTSSVIWLNASVVVVDAGQPDVSTLPIGACPQVAIAYPQPAPVVTQAPPPPPPPAKDTTPPTMSGLNATTTNCFYSVIVSAADNVGVTSVTLTVTGPNPITVAMQPQGGGVWKYEHGESFMANGNYTFAVTAKDAKNNSASAGPVTKPFQCVS